MALRIETLPFGLAAGDLRRRTSLVGLDEALRRKSEFVSVFQEIRDLRDEAVIGYEALLRLPPDVGFEGPLNAFRVAAAAGRLPDLEIAALEAHLAAAHALPAGRLFLNLSALSFEDVRLEPGALTRLVKEAGFAPERIVLELTELVRLHDPVEFARSVRPLREEGFALAVDDFGAGFSNVPLLAELAPDFIKLDASLVTGARAHPRKRVVLEALAQLGRRLNGTVVAEGLETEEDVRAAREAGVPLGQGYVFGRPGAASLHVAGKTRGPYVLRSRLASPEETVEPLVRTVGTVLFDTPVGRLVPLFERDEELAAVPVLDGHAAIGLVTRSLLFFHLGHQYGFSLWRDRPLHRFLSEMDVRHDTLRSDAPLEEAAEVVRRRPVARRYDPILVEAPAGAFHGLLTVDALLAEMTRQKVTLALQSSPLTGLPGTSLLARRAEALLAAGRPFALGWADLDDFKPFNDRYGFARGDAALLLAADVLSRHLGDGPDEILAHAGGDDFAFVVRTEGAEERARAATSEFGERIIGLYDLSDRAAGQIVATDRLGVRRRYGFLSLSVGIVAWNGERGVDYRALASVVAELKCAAKAIEGPAVVLNRRRLGETEGGEDGALLHAALTGSSWNPTIQERNLPGGGLR
ncbi:MAG TPA: EAL domain-containing protein [Thermoanaerobaculia bacterium]|nr:EAL domain-containing protein [Thermoanaerobaculia bacterium]